MDASFDENSTHYVNWVVSLATPAAIKSSDLLKYSFTDEEIAAVKEGIFHDIWNEKALVYKIFATELCFAGDIL